MSRHLTPATLAGWLFAGMAMHSPASAGRQIEVLHFAPAPSGPGAQDRDASAGSPPGLDASADALADRVGQDMRQFALQAALSLDPVSTTGPSDLHAGILPPRLRPLASTACPASSFEPTGWLGPAAELRRASFYDTMAGIACMQGLPVALLDAVIAQESAYNPRAVSHAGAMGLMQIMPGTAAELGLRYAYDAAANMQAGARYLKRQLNRFGRVDLALAAYNAGPERRSLREGRVPQIPETQQYVRAILSKWRSLEGKASNQAVLPRPGYAAHGQPARAQERSILSMTFASTGTRARHQ